MTLALSPLLIFGWGPVPRFGVAGAGLAMILYYVIATTALIAYLRSTRCTGSPSAYRLEWRHLKDILGVGLLSAYRDGRRQPHGRAGHRIRWKLRRCRDRRLRDRIAPRLSADPAAVRARYRVADDGRHEHRRRTDRAGAARRLGRCFHFGGRDRADRARGRARIRELDRALQSSSPRSSGSAWITSSARHRSTRSMASAWRSTSPAKGAGNVAWPLIAGLLRFALVAIGGWYWTTMVGGSLQGLFWIIAASLVLFGLVNASAFATGLSWSHLKPSAIR